MKFAKRVFTAAGIWGLFIIPPLYFLFDRIGRDYPPAISHPEFFYGFVSVTLAWQLAFLVIATDPLRFRPLVLPSMAEKFLYWGSLVVLYAQSRLIFSPSALVLAAVDFGWGVLFVIAFVRTASK